MGLDSAERATGGRGARVRGDGRGRAHAIGHPRTAIGEGSDRGGSARLSERWGASVGDLKRVWLAGAFGNYVNVDSARRIGLLEVPASRVEAAGNTSLRGLKLGLLSATKREAWIAGARSKIEHVALGSTAGFEEMFVECIPFPE